MDPWDFGVCSRCLDWLASNQPLQVG